MKNFQKANLKNKVKQLNFIPNYDGIWGKWNWYNTFLEAILLLLILLPPQADAADLAPKKLDLRVDTASSGYCPGKSLLQRNCQNLGDLQKAVNALSRSRKESSGTEFSPDPNLQDFKNSPGQKVNFHADTIVTFAKGNGPNISLSIITRTRNETGQTKPDGAMLNLMIPTR